MGIFQTKFSVDEESADDGFLYIDVERIVTVMIRRWEGSVLVEICPYGHPEEEAVASIEVADDDLVAARARVKRKRRR